MVRDIKELRRRLKYHKENQRKKARREQKRIQQRVDEEISVALESRNEDRIALIVAAIANQIANQAELTSPSSPKAIHEEVHITRGPMVVPTEETTHIRSIDMSDSTEAHQNVIGITAKSSVLIGDNEEKKRMRDGESENLKADISVDDVCDRYGRSKKNLYAYRIDEMASIDNRIRANVSEDSYIRGCSPRIKRQRYFRINKVAAFRNSGLPREEFFKRRFASTTNKVACRDYNWFVRKWFYNREIRVRRQTPDQSLEVQRQKTELYIEPRYLVGHSQALKNTGIEDRKNAFVRLLLNKSLEHGEAISLIKAKNLVQLFLANRGDMVQKLKGYILTLKEFAGGLLSNMPEQYDEDILPIEVVLGQPSHLKQSEPYFYDTRQWLLEDRKRKPGEPARQYFIETVYAVGDSECGYPGFCVATRKMICMEEGEYNGKACYIPDEDYTVESSMSTEDLSRSQNVKGKDYWFCDPVACGIPVTIAKYMIDLLVTIVATDDIRKLFASDEFKDCQHMAHVRRQEEYDDPDTWLHEVEKLNSADLPVPDADGSANKVQSQGGCTSSVVLEDVSDHTEECDNWYCLGEGIWRERQYGDTVAVGNGGLQEWRECTLQPVSKKAGHSLSCVSWNDCDCRFLLLKKLSVHFESARVILHYLNKIKSYDKALCLIDECLWLGDKDAYSKVLESNIFETGAMCIGETRKEDTDRSRFWKSEAGEGFLEGLAEFPDSICASCRQICYRSSGKSYVFTRAKNGIPTGFESKAQRKNKVTIFNKKAAWVAIIAEADKMDPDDVFLCIRCSTALRDDSKYRQTGNEEDRGQFSSTSIFNGLDMETTPDILRKLSNMEKPFIGLARYFQRVTRLGLQAGFVPYSDRLKALSGNVVYTRMPLKETLKHINHDLLEFPTQNELLLVNGRPTKDRRIWQFLLDFKKLKDAVNLLKKINPLYKNVDYEVTPEQLPETELAEQELQDGLRIASKFMENPVVQGDAMQEFVRNPAAPLPYTKEHLLYDDTEDKDEAEKTMLTRISKQEFDEMVQTNTVHRVHGELPDLDDLQIYKTENPATELLNQNRDDKLDLMCFPVLYPYGRGGQKEHRKVPLRNSDFIKAKLYSSDPKFRRDHQYIFYLLHGYRMRAVVGGIVHTLKTVQSIQGKTAKEVLAMVEAQDRGFYRELTNIFGKIRGSAEYWRDRQRDLEAMIRALGSPTWFLTLSAAEYDWEDMRECLIKLNSDIPDIDKWRNGERCAFDPVNTSRHFHKRLKDIFTKVIMNKTGPLGEIEDAWYRVEYQGRGMQHFHILLWAKNAPKAGDPNVPENDILEYIEKHITCRLPDKEKEAHLHHLVTRYQTHRCNSYCKRVRRIKGKRVMQCRFGFPRPAREQAILRDPVLASYNRKAWKKENRLYDLVRTPEEANINDYNEDLLALWHANMDIQFVGDKTESVVHYIVSYVSKKEHSDTRKIWQEIRENSHGSTAKQLMSFAIRVLAQRECGICEAVDIVTSQPLFYKSRNTKYLCAKPKQKRPVRIKDIKAVKQLVSDGLGDEEDMVIERNWITDYYPARPSACEEMSLYSFSESWRKASKQEVSSHERHARLEEHLNDVINFLALGGTCTEDHTSTSIDPNLETEANSESSLGKEIDRVYRSADPNLDTEDTSISTASYDRMDCVFKEIIGEVEEEGQRAKQIYPFEDKSLGYAIKVEKPFMITHPKLSLSKRPDEYYYAMLLMFVPFRKEDEIVQPSEMSLRDLFFSKLADPKFESMKNYHEKLQEREGKLRENEEKEDHFRQEDEMRNSHSPDEEPNVFGAPVYDAVDDVRDMQDISTEMSLDEYVSKFNSDQQSTYDIITETLSQRLKAVNQGDATMANQLLMFVTGFGGTGKTFLIDAIRSWWKACPYTENKPIAVAAPTGVASANISGITIHRLLHLPIEKPGSSGYQVLYGSDMDLIRKEMGNLQLLLLDEVSMVSNQMLLYMHIRLTEITRKYDQLFGGINIVCFGDFFQLPPCKADYVFESLVTYRTSGKFKQLVYKLNKKNAFSNLVHVDLWPTFFNQYSELNINMRQSDDSVYSDILNNIRYGMLTREQLDILNTRLISVDAKSDLLEQFVDYYLNLRTNIKDVVCLIPNVEAVRQFNECLLRRHTEETGQPVLEILSQDAFVNLPKSAQKNNRLVTQLLQGADENVGNTAGLEHSLQIAVGCRVMLRRNLDLKSHLVNGALGTVLAIRNCGMNNDYIEVKFDKTQIPERVERLQVDFNLTENISVKRSQFPLILAYAMTIHKCQGLTVHHALVDVGNMTFGYGMTYVALSRIKTLCGLHLMNFDPQKIRVDPKCLAEINRLKQLHGKPIIEVTRMPLPSVRDRVWYKATNKCLKRKMHQNIRNMMTDSKKKRLDTILQRKRQQEFENRGLANTKSKLGKKRKATTAEITAVDHTASHSKRPKMASSRSIECNVSMIVPVIPDPQSQNIFRANITYPRFRNRSLFCYANAAMQAMLVTRAFMSECASITDPVQPLHKELKDLHAAVLSGNVHTPFNLDKLRGAVDAKFISEDYQDSLEFLTLMLQKAGMIGIFPIQIARTDKCFNEQCAYTRDYDNDISDADCISLHMDHGPNFAQMMSAWMEREGSKCPVCHGAKPLKFQERIVSTRNQVLLRLGRYKLEDNRTTYKFDNRPVTCFQPDNVQIAGKNMQVKAAVCHYEGGLYLEHEKAIAENRKRKHIFRGVNPRVGHYKAIVRSVEFGWLMCNDSSIERIHAFPNGLENVAFLVLESVIT